MLPAQVASNAKPRTEAWASSLIGSGAEFAGMGVLLTDFIIAAGLGMAAGLLDALPMLKMPAPRFSIYSTFLQWLVLGLLIPFVDWDLAPWLKGMLIGLLGMLPNMVVVYHRNRKALLTTALAGAVLGAAIGAAGGVWIDN